MDPQYNSPITKYIPRKEKKSKLKPSFNYKHTLLLIVCVTFTFCVLAVVFRPPSPSYTSEVEHEAPTYLTEEQVLTLFKDHFTSFNNDFSLQIQGQINNIQSDLPQIITEINLLKSRISELDNHLKDLPPHRFQDIRALLTDVRESYNNTVANYNNVERILRNQQEQIKRLNDRSTYLESKVNISTSHSSPISQNIPQTSSPQIPTTPVNQEPFILIDESSGTINSTGLSKEEVEHFLRNASSTSSPNSNSSRPTPLPESGLFD